MGRTSGADEPPRGVRAGGILTALAVAASLFWEGVYLRAAGEVFAQVRVPIPGLFVLLHSLAPWGYHAAAVAAFVLIAAKDVWVRERIAQRIDAVAIAAAFLFYIVVELTVKAPFMSLMQGIGRPS